MLDALSLRLYRWLAASNGQREGDLIFALAGRESRKRYALELFFRHQARHLLLSVGRFEIRGFSRLGWPVAIDLLHLAAAIPVPQRHFFVSLESGCSQVELIPRKKLGTWSEIRALANWLAKRPHLQKLVIVSSAFHLRRVRLCCRAWLPNSLELHLLAVENHEEAFERESWRRNRSSRAVVLGELPKLLIYWLLVQARRLGLAITAGASQVVATTTGRI